MYHSILVPTDGSDVAAAAADAALELAGRFDAAVHAVYVREGDESDDTEGERAADDLRVRADAAGLDASAGVVESDEGVHRAVLNCATDVGADCIVMGTYGRTGIDRFVLGSVAERTLRESTVPVVTVHEATVLDAEFDALLVPTDGSEGAQAAADHGVALATATGAAVHAVHVVDLGVVWDDYDAATVLESLQSAGARAVDAVGEQARDAGVASVETAVLNGPIARTIANYADEHNASAVVMGTHGRTGLERYFLGSVTERLVRLTDVPVVTVKAPEEGETPEGGKATAKEATTAEGGATAEDEAAAEEGTAAEDGAAAEDEATE